MKKILLSFASLFLAYRSVELVRYLDIMHPTRFNWLGVFIFAFVLNLFITGVFAFLGFAFLTSKILPNSYYKIRNSEALTFAYRILGVDYFKLLLLKLFWGREENRQKYFNGTKSGITDFDTQTRQSEFGHLAAFISVFVVSIYMLSKGYIAVFCITNLINIIGNLYPIILQRNHRVQIERIKAILDKRRSDQVTL